MRQIVTAEDVLAVPPGGELSASVGAVVTPWAQEVAATRGVRIARGTKAAGQPGIVAVGADHGGFELKEEVKAHLTRLGWRFRDLGTFSTDPVDYPDLALAVSRMVQAGEAELGILVDGAGIGSAMAANKVPGIRAALCGDAETARGARTWNDANVLALSLRTTSEAVLTEILDAWFAGQPSTDPTDLANINHATDIV